MNSIRRILFGVIIGFTLLMACAIARADTIATSPNTDGGLIRLTDDEVKGCEAGTRLAWTTVRTGAATPGCWRLDGDSVIVVWYVGPREIPNWRIYELSGFTRTDYLERTYGK